MFESSKHRLRIPKESLHLCKMQHLLLLILLIPLHLHAISADLLSERAILLSLKQQWGNPPSLESWNSTSSPWDWPEVRCSPDAVIGLRLAKKKLSGIIPSSIGQLQGLVSIELSTNNISGNIPHTLHNCSNLEILDLSFNALSGTIPGEFSLMERLKYLYLNGNGLFGEVPNGLGKLPKLSVLDLSDNQLSGSIVETVIHLKNVNALRLHSNEFSAKIPSEYVSEHFDESSLDPSNLCSDNRIEGLPGCPSGLCFDSRIRRFLKCNSSKDESRRHLVVNIFKDTDESRRHLVINTFKAFGLGVVVGLGVVGFAILFYYTRKCWIKRHDYIAVKKARQHGPPSLEEGGEWNMISFQGVKFDKDEILSSLIDENVIGDGGSGKVYRVFTNHTRSIVAVKSVSNAAKSQQSLEKEFLAEIRTLGSIRHNNIVKLLCYISSKNMKLLVYQYFENKSLDHWLHGNKRQTSSVDGINSVPKLDWPMRLHIAIGIAQGLCYMHHDCSPPIIHRDIKPRNILLDSKLNAIIADFGLAKLLNRHRDITTTSVVAGTVGYIDPEYAYTKKVNSKSDVYSFGVVLLELATGRKAVIREDHMNLAGRARLLYRDTNAMVDALDAEIIDPIYMNQIITTFRLGVICTSASPSNRPSMKDCLHILQNCSNNFSSSSALPDYDSLV